jgi:hypothetical protein
MTTAGKLPSEIDSFSSKVTAVLARILNRDKNRIRCSSIIAFESDYEDS